MNFIKWVEKNYHVSIYDITDTEYENLYKEYKEKDMGGLVKRTERGWAGHFICANNCSFRRNTLLEYENKKYVVSTVGGLRDPLTHEMMSVGANRWYETMVFEAEERDGYIDAIPNVEISFDSEWGLWADSWENLLKKYSYPDNDANNMHEKVVNEIVDKILNGEL